MNDSIIIRDFVAADHDAVNRTAVSTWRQFENDFEDWQDLSALVANTAALAADAELIVAERHGEIVGVVGYIAPGRPREAVFPVEWGIIRMLCVLPHERGQGLGQRLTEMCIARARRDGAHRIGLHTTTVLRSAIDLYTRMGFAFQRALPDRRGASCVLYALTIC